MNKQTLKDLKTMYNLIHSYLSFRTAVTYKPYEKKAQTSLKSLSLNDKTLKKLILEMEEA